MVPEGDRHVVELQWAVPPEQRLYREAPASYLSHLLGYADNCNAVVFMHVDVKLVSIPVRASRCWVNHDEGKW